MAQGIAHLGYDLNGLLCLPPGISNYPAMQPQQKSTPDQHGCCYDLVHKDGAPVSTSAELIIQRANRQSLSLRSRSPQRATAPGA